jgi:hypothetical protein
MTFDNTEIRRDYLAREYLALNDRIAELQSTMRAYAEQKANVVRAMRDTGLSVIAVADRLGLTRQALYNVLQAAEGRYDDLEAELLEPKVEGPRRFLVQHLDLGTGRHGQNWTAYRHTLGDALAVADLAYNAADDPTEIRQEIIDTVTGEWRFRNVGDMGWSPPTVARAPDVDMDGLLSTGQQNRRSPEYEGDRRITEQADGTWGFYCPHSAGDTDVKLFPEMTMAMAYADAHDRVIHGEPTLASLFKNEIVR